MPTATLNGVCPECETDLTVPPIDRGETLSCPECMLTLRVEDVQTGGCPSRWSRCSCATGVSEMTKSVAIVADRISWEERELIKAGPDFGLNIEWVNDESLCLGHPDAPSVHDYDALLLRSRSYTRGGLIATLAEGPACRSSTPRGR